MSDTGAFYIVTVAGGKCLENTQGANGVLDCLPKDDSRAQQWVVETEDDENTVAFKSCADGKYLRNNEPNKICWGKIGVGEKQWWTLEKGRTPGSCAIRSNACTAGASYLNDFQGRYQDSNYVHMWQMEKNLEFWLTWYFRDASNAAFGPQGMKASADPAGGDELQAREAALAKKEEELKTSADQQRRDFEQQEAALKKQQQALTAQVDKMTSQQSKKATAPDCGHKVYPPPRKLEKKVVGFLYEGQAQNKATTASRA